MPPEDTLTSEWDLIAALSREFGAGPCRRHSGHRRRLRRLGR